MTNQPDDAVRAAADQVIKLEEEVEASGFAGLDDLFLQHARSELHQWVDEVVGAVVSPGLGRVTLIHRNGRRSSIASPDLAFRMSAPVKPRTTD